MKRILTALLLALATCYVAQAQVTSQRVVFTTSNPPTTCVAGKVYTNTGLNPAKAWVGTSTGACTEIDASAAAPSNATYITQTPNASLSGEQALSLLATGIPLVTTTTGVVSISSVTNDAQTKASIVPNTAPLAGQILAGNAGGTAYAPVAMSGDATLASTGAITLASTIVAAGPTGSATVAPIITYDAKGRLTTVSSATITPAVGSITGLGTGVATALAVNVGSAGAPVVNGGALGTPSSGVGTNISGLTLANHAAQATNTVVGNATSGSAAPTALAVGTCSTSGSALIWTTNTGFGCNTAIAASTATTATTATDTTSKTGTGSTYATSTSPSFTTPTLGVATGTRLGLGQAAGASNPLEMTTATDQTGMKLTNSNQTPIFDIYTGNVNASARNWRIATNYDAFGDLVFVRGTSQGAAPSSTAIHITPAGDLAVNTTDEATSATAAAFTVAGGAGFSKKMFIPSISTSSGLQTAVLCQSSAGEMIADSVACLASSGRFKYQVKPLGSGLKEVMALRPISFRYKPEGIFANNKNFQSERVGLAAEEVEKVDKRLVGYEKDGVTPRSVGYEQIVPLLIKGMQEQQGQIAADHALMLKLAKENARLRRLIKRRR